MKLTLIGRGLCAALGAAILLSASLAAAPAFATDLSLTAANVIPGVGASLEQGTAGEALTAGKAVYKKAADKKWYMADCNAAAAEARQATAIATTGSAAGQPVIVQKGGPITIGGTVASGTAYFLSGTAGGIRPAADNTTGDYPQIIGMGISTTQIQLQFGVPSPTAL